MIAPELMPMRVPELVSQLVPELLPNPWCLS
jgi:hypothetical protein